MRLGALIGLLSPQPQPVEVAEQAKRYDGEGFESLWMVQAIGRGFIIPDPLVALAVAATATQNVELGTAIVQISLYQPADLAHRIFSLMQVCGTRLTLGVGAGSTRPPPRPGEPPRSARMTAMSTTTRPRVLSGIQPTADSFHFGNYLGALQQWVDLQREHQPCFFIAAAVFTIECRLRA